MHTICFKCISTIQNVCKTWPPHVHSMCSNGCAAGVGADGRCYGWSGRDIIDVACKVLLHSRQPCPNTRIPSSACVLFFNRVLVFKCVCFQRWPGVDVWSGTLHIISNGFSVRALLHHTHKHKPTHTRTNARSERLLFGLLNRVWLD